MMKTVRIAVKTAAVFFSVLSVLIFSSLIYIQLSVSDNFLVSGGDSLHIESPIPIRLSRASGDKLYRNQGRSL